MFTRVTGLFILHFSRILGAISVDEDLVLEKVDNSYTITATVFPSNATNKNLTWTTSDESVATVDNGVITAVGPGTATITVTSVADSSKKATVHVVVGDILVPAIFADDPTLGTLQGVIDKAEPGSTIVVAPATYNEQLIINKPLTLLGPNADIAGAAEKRYPEAIIKGTGNGLSQLLEIDAENVEINGFTFDDTRIDNYNNTTGTNTNLIGGIAIVNNRFINTSGTAIYLRDGRNAPGEYSKDIQICNNKIETIISAGTVDYNAGSGIIVMGAEDLRICGNIISNAAYNGIQLARNKNATVTDNIVTDSEQTALQIAQWNEGVHRISGNTFSTKSEEKGAIRLYGFTNNYIPEFNISNNKIENSHYGIQIGHGDAGKSYNDISEANYTLSDNSFNEISENELIIYLNQEPSDNDVAEMNSLFKEVYGEEYSSKAKTNEDPFTYVVNILKVGEGKEFTTIQEAIDAAAAGDVIIVGDGEYTENLTINKAITLKSLNGRESTEIAGTITITADDVTVEGFTVTAQGYYAVPVIHMIDIDNVNILNNTVVADDTAYGAIGTSSAPAKITGKISGNTVTGMIMVGTDGAVEVSNNNVTLTTASTEGICFYPVGSTAEITVTGNTVGDVTEGNVQIKVNERPASVNEKTTAVEMLAAITADNNGATAKLAWLSDSIAVIGATGYLTLQAAIDAALDGDTINILGDCTLIGATANNKDLTFVGNSSKPKIEFPQGKDQPNYQTYYGCEFTFENLTLQCEPDKNYQGIQPDKVIARNCVINGKFWGYAKDLEFTDCIFNQETSYNIWTYSSNATFKDCKFYSKGRSVLIYNEGATMNNPAEIKFNNCEFYASEKYEEKAAIEISTYAYPHQAGSFNVEINNCSATGFDTKTKAGGVVLSAGLANLKEIGVGRLLVNIDGEIVYCDFNIINKTQIKGYNTIKEAIDEAMAGDEIFVSAGTYDINTITLTKPISIIGEVDEQGTKLTKITGVFGVASDEVIGTTLFKNLEFTTVSKPILLGTADGQKLDEIVIDGVVFAGHNTTKYRTLGPNVDSPNLVINKLTIKNSKFGVSLGIYLTGDIGTLEIIDNEFNIPTVHWGTSYAAVNINQYLTADNSVNPSGTYTVSGNKIILPSGASPESYKGVITNQGLGSLSNCPGGKELIANGNTLYVGETQDTTSPFINDAIATANATLKVYNETLGKYYNTIEAAIAEYNNAENGDYTIIIKDGTYKKDSIMIRQQVDKSLTIKAENNLKAIFVNENTADSTGIFHISGGSKYDTGAVTFEGIRFELPAGANIDCFGIKLLGESDGGTIHRYASNVTVRNCEFIGNVEKSCAVWSGAGSQPKNILIEGCKGDGLTALYNGYGNGITIKNSQLTNARGLLNSQSTESANELVIEGVEATIDYQPSKDMDAIKINGGRLTVKDSNITLYYNGANRSSGLIVIRGGATIVINNSTLTANKVGGDYDVYTFYGMNPANRSNTVFEGDIEDFTYGGTFEQDVTNIVEELEAAVSTFNDAKQEVIDEDEIGVPGEGEEPEDEEEPEELDIAPLDTAIQEAIATKEGVAVSQDGTDLPAAGTYWVTQMDMDALDAAIANAEAAKESAKTQQDVTNIVEELEAAVSTFNDAKQEVIDEEEIGVPGEGEESVQAEEPAEDEKSVEDEEAVEGEEQEE